MQIMRCSAINGTFNLFNKGCLLGTVVHVLVHILIHHTVIIRKCLFISVHQTFQAILCLHEYPFVVQNFFSSKSSPKKTDLSFINDE